MFPSPGWTGRDRSALLTAAESQGGEPRRAASAGREGTAGVHVRCSSAQIVLFRRCAPKWLVRRPQPNPMEGRFPMARLLFVMPAASYWTLKDGTRHATGCLGRGVRGTVQGADRGGPPDRGRHARRRDPDRRHDEPAARHGGQRADRAGPGGRHPVGGGDAAADPPVRGPPRGLRRRLPARRARPDAGPVGRPRRGTAADGGARLGKPLAIVCHGPAAMLATRVRGESPFSGYQVTAFTNEEENGVGLASMAPWLLEDELVKLGVDFTRGRGLEAVHGGGPQPDDGTEPGVGGRARRAPAQGPHLVIWVDPEGGPLAVAAESELPHWSPEERYGVIGDELVEVVRFGPASLALILGDEPATTTFIPSIGAFVRWIYAERHTDVRGSWRASSRTSSGRGGRSSTCPARWCSSTPGNRAPR